MANISDAYGNIIFITHKDHYENIKLLKDEIFSELSSHNLYNYFTDTYELYDIDIDNAEDEFGFDLNNYISAKGWNKEDLCAQTCEFSGSGRWVYYDNIEFFEKKIINRVSEEKLALYNKIKNDGMLIIYDIRDFELGLEIFIHNLIVTSLDKEKYNIIDIQDKKLQPTIDNVKQLMYQDIVFCFDNAKDFHTTMENFYYDLKNDLINSNVKDKYKELCKLSCSDWKLLLDNSSEIYNYLRLKVKEIFDFVTIGDEALNEIFEIQHACDPTFEKYIIKGIEKMK